MVVKIYEKLTNLPGIVSDNKRSLEDFNFLSSLKYRNSGYMLAEIIHSIQEIFEIEVEIIAGFLTPELNIEPKDERQYVFQMAELSFPGADIEMIFQHIEDGLIPKLEYCDEIVLDEKNKTVRLYVRPSGD